MAWDNTELMELTDEASPFATAPRPYAPPATAHAVADDAFATRESPFSPYTPDAATELEGDDEAADALPGYTIEETLRPTDEDEAVDEASSEFASERHDTERYDAEASFAPAHESAFESPFSPALESFDAGPEAEAPYAVAEEELDLETGTDLRRRIVDVALAELRVWDNGRRHELEQEMRPTLKAYWETLLSPADAEKYIDKGHAWSAAFVSTVMKRAGAGSAFEQNAFHAGYTANAKVSRARRDGSKFWAFSPSEATPEPGDVVVRARTSTDYPVCLVTFDNVERYRTHSTHGDVVVAVRPDSIDVVGGNVTGPHRRKLSDTVAQKTLRLDATGRLVQPATCQYFAIVKPPGASVAAAPQPVSVPTAGVIDAITSLPGRIAAAVRTGLITIQAGAALARGERDEGTLTNLVFYARHPELPSGYKIQAHEKQLVQDWMRIRDEIIRPLLRTLASDRASAPPSPAAPTAGGGINSKTVARIDAHKAEIERAASSAGVSPNILRGIIAAESGGNERTGEGGSGYKGLMQSGRDPSHLTPSVSLREGAKKFVDFTRSMQKFFRETLNQDFTALPEDTRLRIVMAGYNAGPGTVKRAMRFARAAGDVTRWGDAEHYIRALVSTGAYNPVASVLEWCVKKGQLSPDAMAADLARLSGKPATDVQRAYLVAGKWSVKGLAAALRPYLFREKTQLKNDGSTTLSQAQSRASKSVLCAAAFKQSHTAGYLDTIVRYKRYYDGR